MWSLVVKFKAYAATDPNATLWDKPEYRPLIGERPPDSIHLFELCGKNIRLANVIAEVKGKVTVKTLTWDQRRLASTTIRRASAIVRDFHPSIAYIDEKLPWARAHLKAGASTEAQAQKARDSWLSSLADSMNPKALLSAIVQVDVSGWDAQQPDASDVDLRRAEEERLQRLESEEFSRQLADELDDEPDDT
eukprot:6431659-Prymnesium_polylepis.1